LLARPTPLGATIADIAVLVWSWACLFNGGKLVFSAAQIANKSIDPPLPKELKERSSRIAPEPKKCKKAIRQKRPSEAAAHEHAQN